MIYVATDFVVLLSMYTDQKAQTSIWILTIPLIIGYTSNFMSSILESWIRGGISQYIIQIINEKSATRDELVLCEHFLQRESVALAKYLKSVIEFTVNFTALITFTMILFTLTNVSRQLDMRMTLTFALVCLVIIFLYLRISRYVGDLRALHAFKVSESIIFVREEIEALVGVKDKTVLQNTNLLQKHIRYLGMVQGFRAVIKQVPTSFFDIIVILGLLGLSFDTEFSDRAFRGPSETSGILIGYAVLRLKTYLLRVSSNLNGIMNFRSARVAIINLFRRMQT